MSSSEIRSVSMKGVEFLPPSFFEGPLIYVHNIYDREVVFNASYGTKIIPACPIGQEFAKPLVIPYMVPDFVQKTTDEGGVEEKAIPGVHVVREILRMPADMHQVPCSEWGVFDSANEVPTRKELNAAKEKLIPRLRAKVDEGNKLFNGTAAERQMIGMEHRKAVRWLNEMAGIVMEPEWMGAAIVTQRCPFCGVAVMPNMAFCPNGDVLDEARARIARPYMFTNVPAAKA